MAICPRDGTPLADDYGMTTCPKCGAIIFVDMDGEAQIGSMTPSHTPQPDSPRTEGSPVENPVLDGSIPDGPAADASPEAWTGGEFSGDAFALLEPASTSSNDSDLNSNVNANVAGEQQPEAAYQPEMDYQQPEAVYQPDAAEQSEATGAEESEFNMDSLLGYGDASSQAEDPPAADGGYVAAGGEEGMGMDMDMSMSGPDDPLGISEYANSEFSQAKDGPLLFRLIISGIDSKEIRASLREAMEDSRFGWDVDEIMRGAVRGELKIDHVSPVKATILISRIKCIPVRIRWEQYVVTQADSF